MAELTRLGLILELSSFFDDFHIPEVYLEQFYGAKEFDQYLDSEELYDDLFSEHLYKG